RWRKDSQNFYAYGAMMIAKGKIYKDYRKGDENAKDNPDRPFMLDYSKRSKELWGEYCREQISEASLKLFSQYGEDVKQGTANYYPRVRPEYWYEFYRTVSKIISSVDIVEPKVKKRNSTSICKYVSPSKEQKAKRHKDASKMIYGRGTLWNPFHKRVSAEIKRDRIAEEKNRNNFAVRQTEKTASRNGILALEKGFLDWLKGKDEKAVLPYFP